MLPKVVSYGDRDRDLRDDVIGKVDLVVVSMSGLKNRACGDDLHHSSGGLM